MSYFLTFVIGQILSGATASLIHQIILHRRRVAADVKAQLDALGNPPQIPVMPTPRIDSAVPFLDEDKPVKMKPKFLGWIIFAVAVAATSWGAIKWDIVATKHDVAEQGDQLKEIKAQLIVIQRDARESKDAIAEARSESKLINLRIENFANTMNLKLDYLTSDKRGPRPASGSSN